MTLEILAKRVPPGIQHRDVEITDRAIHLWRSDGGAAHPNIVFVEGSERSLAMLRGVARQHKIALIGSSRNTFVWDFSTKSEADHFFRLVENIADLHFWQVGRSDVYASTGQFPLLAQFLHYDMDGRLLVRNADERERMVHQLRKKAAEIEKEKRLHREPQVAIVFLSNDIVQYKRLPRRPWYKPLKILKNTLEPGESLFGFTESFWSGQVTVAKQAFIYHVLREKHEARDYFRRAGTRNVGFGYMFGVHDCWQM